MKGVDNISLYASFVSSYYLVFGVAHPVKHAQRVYSNHALDGFLALLHFSWFLFGV